MYDYAEGVSAMIARLGLDQHTMSFVGQAGEVGISEQEIVAQGWDLAALAAHYEAVLAALREAAPEDGDGKLFAHVRMISEWQRFPFSDPQLPDALLPDWIGRRAARHIEVMRAQWSGPVRPAGPRSMAGAGSSGRGFGGCRAWG
ncbi:MAG: PaaX family transcriptional regulator C-terminal domain-containing protein [Actinomycetota bacterium]